MIKEDMIEIEKANNFLKKNKDKRRWRIIKRYSKIKYFKYYKKRWWWDLCTFINFRRNF